MNGSPSLSPRRLQRQRPVSPLATQPRNNDDSSVDAIGTNSANGTSSNGHADDQGGFYQVSLSDGPALPPANPSSNLSSRSSSPLRSFTHSYSQSYSHSSNSYGRSFDLGSDHDRDNNYGYRPSYKDDASAASHNKTSGTSASLRPVQEYHNAYSDTGGPNTVPLDSPLSLPPPPSATGSSSPTSKFATFSSASRAFLEHRRNQSISNLMPTISSIGRNLGRAISPDRSLQPSQSPKRPPIPDYRDERSSRRESYSGDDDSEDDDDSASSDGSYSDEDEDDSNDDSEDDDDEPRHRRSNVMAPFTGDSRTSRRNNTNTSRNNDRQSDTASVASGFTNWLSGGTVKATSPDRASILATSRTTTPEPSIFAARGGPGHTRRSMSLASNASLTPRSSILATSNASPSRFSQLATSMSATLSRLTQQPPVSPRSAGAGFENDELYHLDVDAALFPAGHTSERDVFSPSSYKNLEVNAAGALRRMQAAYRQRSVALRDMTAEKSVRDEELEEVETRAQHLKMQLEGMARRAADQQREMEILVEELAAERKARAQERAMLLSGAPTTLTATLINEASSGSPPRERDDDQATSVVLSEDLDVDEAQRDQLRRQAWRRRSLKSNGSSIDDTDDGEGSTADDYESGSSMFSRSRSPTIAPSISFSFDNGAGGNDNHHQVHHPRVAALGSARQSSRSVSSSSTATVVSQSQPMSTFQKLVKNVTAAIKDEEPDMLGMGTTSCHNCRGQDVSFAWNTVSVLRDENKHLKQRVGQLEVAVEGALDMVNGVGL
ncbi:hypothetical protein F503_05413 [Ophiostoma piceae UAMH 11346]|uniref:Uncharacterized protein n=1 Tax=Ophiostoma piceae (strain UAMH 11346) TaxID=1262450 RepID=S3CUC4_OPHP1|nr:hypothetical protein F503_05413 [Ophiostoma piceae UAMH 11346]